MRTHCMRTHHMRTHCMRTHHMRTVPNVADTHAPIALLLPPLPLWVGIGVRVGVGRWGLSSHHRVMSSHHNVRSSRPQSTVHRPPGTPCTLHPAPSTFHLPPSAFHLPPLLLALHAYTSHLTPYTSHLASHIVPLTFSPPTSHLWACCEHEVRLGVRNELLVPQHVELWTMGSHVQAPPVHALGV